MAESKVHPLWYSEFIPILFFVSSIFAGLTMVVFQGTFIEKAFRHRMSEEYKAKSQDITFGLARISGAAMYVYLFVIGIAFIHGGRWAYLEGSWGLWWLVEIVGFTAIPAVLLLTGANERNMLAVRLGSILTIIGIVLNRLNISIIAFRWNAPDHYIPTWMEVVVAMGVLSVQFWIFRWVIERMPVLGDPPAWARHDEPKAATWPVSNQAAGLH
jgi:Ni/Fe-hydrogenase subunit HybB-like protein